MAIDFLGALGAGSDIDTNNLVDSLVAAERAPKEASLNKKIAKAEVEISAYGTVLGSMSSLADAFSGLNDLDDFKDYTVNVNGAVGLDGGTAYSVDVNTDVVPGITEIVVQAIATRDRWVSTGTYAAENSALNAGNPFSFDIELDGVTTSINITDPTPQGVVEAVNNLEIGIEASLVNTGESPNPLRIVFAGGLGEDNAFVLSNNTGVNGNAFDLSTHATVAGNAELYVNGIYIERGSNTVDDVLGGATINLIAETAGTSQIAIDQNKAGVESRLRELVNTYNAMEASFDLISNPEGAEELSGALSGNSSFKLIRDKIKELIIAPSSTGTDNLNYLNDLGIQFERTGLLEIDDDRLSAALNSNFDDVIEMLSANTNDQSNFGEAARGIAGDAIVTLNEMMDADGIVSMQAESLEEKISTYQEGLDDLDRRMSQIYDRYLAQFTAMETAVDRMNSLRDYLDQQLSALPFTNKDN